MDEMDSVEEGMVPGLSPGALVDDREVNKREERRLVAELTPIFNTVDRVLTIMRVYPTTHQLVGELVAGLVQRFEPVLEREEQLFVNLDADVLKTESGAVFYSRELADKEQFVWYGPYADGLLQLEFRRGITLDELRRFLRVIDRAAQGLISSDDDTVTLLWEQQLEHIKYYAVEGFVDAGLEEFGRRTEREAVELIVDAAISPGGEEAEELNELFGNLNLTHLDLFTRMQVEANAKVITPELRDQDLAHAFSVEPELVDKLASEWVSGADLEYRLIEALLSIIRTSPRSAAAGRAGELILGVARQLFEAEMFDQAVRVLELLQDRRALFADSGVDPLGELVDELSDPMQVEALVNLFQVRVPLREPIGRLFRLLTRATVLRQLLLLIGDAKRTPVALGDLVDIVMELSKDDPESTVTSQEFMDRPIYLRRIMGELITRDFANWKPTPRFIRKAIDAADPEIRELGLQLNHSCWSDPGLARDYLVPMADDPDERIRKLALERLGEKHPQMFQEAIRDTLLARKMGDRTHAELRFLMRIFLDTSTDAAPFLRSLIETKGWFGGSSREFAKMAAAVLVQAGDEEVRQKIEAAQKSFFTSPELKRAYEQILERFAPVPTRQVQRAEEER